MFFTLRISFITVYCFSLRETIYRVATETLWIIHIVPENIRAFRPAVLDSKQFFRFLKVFPKIKNKKYIGQQNNGDTYNSLVFIELRVTAGATTII